MVKNFIKKKNIILSGFFSYSGLGLIMVTAVLYTQIKIYSIMFGLIVLGILFLIIGAYLLCEKCKCPYCGFGKNGKFSDGKYHKLISLCAVKKGFVLCPKCKKEIDIK